MNLLVLDCSITASWLFEDEISTYAETVLDGLASGFQAMVPALWPLEVTNVLLVGERRKRIREVHSTVFWETLKSLPIQIDAHTHKRASDTTISLGREYGLSAYDAAYLELALRHAAPLATLDKKLVKAANKAGVKRWLRKTIS